MAITYKSKLKDIVGNDEAFAIVQKHIPVMDRKDPKLQQVMGMSLKDLLAIPALNCPKEIREAIEKDLEAANIE